MWDETLSSACPRTRRNVQPWPETAEGEALVSVPGRFPPPVPPHRVSPPVRQSLPVPTPAQGPTRSRGRSQRLPSAGTGKPGHLSVTAAPTRGAALPCKSVSVGKRTAAALAPCALAAAWTPPGLCAPRGLAPPHSHSAYARAHQPSAGQVHACAHTMHIHHAHSHTCAHMQTCCTHMDTPHTRTRVHTRTHAHSMHTQRHRDTGTHT